MDDNLVKLDRLKNCKDFNIEKYLTDKEYQKDKHREYTFYNGDYDYCSRNIYYFIQSQELKKSQEFNNLMKKN